MTKQQEITITDGEMLEALATTFSNVAKELKQPELIFLGAVVSMEIMEKLFVKKEGGK